MWSTSVRCAGSNSFLLIGYIMDERAQMSTARLWWGGPTFVLKVSCWCRVPWRESTPIWRTTEFKPFQTVRKCHISKNIKNKRRCSVAQVFALGDFLFLFVRVIRIRVVDISARTSLCWVGYWHTCLETLSSDMRLAWWCFWCSWSRCCYVSEFADTLEGDLKFLAHLINFIPIVRNRDFEIKTIPACHEDTWVFFEGMTNEHPIDINSCSSEEQQYPTERCLLRLATWPISSTKLHNFWGAEWCGLFRLEPRALAMETRPREGRVLTIRYELVHHDDLWQHTTSYIIKYIDICICMNISQHTICNAFGALVSSWFGSEAAVCCQCLMMVVTSGFQCLWKPATDSVYGSNPAFTSWYGESHMCSRVSEISTDSLHTIYKTFTHPNWCRMSYALSHKLHKLMSPRWTIPSMKIPLSSSSTPKNWTFLLSWRSWYWQLFTRFLLGIDLIEARRSKVTKKPSKGLHDARHRFSAFLPLESRPRVVDWKCVSDSCSLACFSLGPLKTLNFRAALDPRSCYWPNGTKDWKLGYKNSTEWWVTLRTLMQHLPVFATKTAAMMSSAACGNSCGLMTEIGGCVCSLVFCSLTFSKTCVCSQLFGDVWCVGFCTERIDGQLELLLVCWQFPRPRSPFLEKT